MVDGRIRVDVLAAQLCAPVPGGTGRYTRELLTSLAAAAARHTAPRREVVAVAPRGCLEAGGLGVPVRTLPVPGRVLPLVWERGLPPRLRSADVVHAPTMLVPPTDGGTRLVVTCHDVVPWTHPQTLTRRGVGFHRRMGERMAARADLVITPTAAVARQVREILVPRAEVVPVLSGASSLTVPADAGSRVAALGVRSPYLLFVGTAEPRKGLDVLVAALAHPDLRDLSLVVVGPAGWGDVDVAASARDAGVGDRVRVVGRVDDPTLAALYDAAAALAMPSRAEGFGLPVVEAMALGTPAVTSDDPALVEVGGGATLVAPVGDAAALAGALARAAADGPERARLREAGRRRADELSWTVAAETMWGLYAGLGS